VLCPGCRVCTINGVSKLFASPDLKVSWIVATGPDADRVAGLLEVQNDLYLSASSVSQHVASRMFDAGPESQRRIVREVATRRRAMLDALGGIPGVSFTPPAGGIHLPVRVGRELLPSGWDDQELAVALLERAGVAAHPGYLYGVEESDPTDPVVLVMSYLSPAEVIREGVDRIGSVLGRF